MEGVKERGRWREGERYKRGRERERRRESEGRERERAHKGERRKRKGLSGKLKFSVSERWAVSPGRGLDYTVSRYRAGSTSPHKGLRQPRFWRGKSADQNLAIVDVFKKRSAGKRFSRVLNSSAEGSSSQLSETSQIVLGPPENPIPKSCCWHGDVERRRLGGDGADKTEGPELSSELLSPSLQSVSAT
ncbi:hypothetical protein EYF80_012477 [Liparis tanakae]|uniref:Uncharacterized protein n=1 Tax=Liparis tanakae TaxID=230148 RepID=A0A4Z2IJM8_9TELE|nr:hypothetical protein EYF80_012477 [Liparis tanakae]